uniref:Uncharacterized protein n=1 Tax=Mycena chlorophos TaxID=658473 RepID=A0ABQ0L8X2_MYCCL|nr:predicted protein [Mycena chlorophos]
MDLAPQSPNDRKVALYDEATTEQRSKWEDEGFESALTWRHCGGTFAQALELFELVPPLRSGDGGSLTKKISESEKNLPHLTCVKSIPDWVEHTIAAHSGLLANTCSPGDVTGISRAIAARDRRAPYAAAKEVVERTTDEYHRIVILEPAALIATGILEESIISGYSNARSGAIGDLLVYVGSEDDIICLVAEDKRAPVFKAHEKQFRDYRAY